ncbi:hypothetical protein F4806DRAFT_108195 [Annulohypoxylon nitens]|nr:hypothetical protein F4806DRAFT_108195 [Annulohypoxylon nitens]
MAAKFVSEDDVLQRYSSATTFPPSDQSSQVKYDEIEVVPRGLGYGASDIPYDVHPGTHAYAGLDNNLQYPVVFKLLQDMPHVPDDNLGNGSELEHFSLRQGIGDDEKPGPIANFATTYHWTVCVPGLVGSLKQIFRDEMNVSKQQAYPSDVLIELIESRDKWLNQLRRDNPWRPMKPFPGEWPRPYNGLQSAPFQFNGQLPVFRDYKVTKKLLRLIHNFEKKYPRDILPKGQIIFAVFVWHYLQHRAEDAPYEPEAVWPACQVPLGHFIIYFIEYLKRTEVFQLAYYPHPFHFVGRAYDHDWKRDSEKYGTLGSGISSEEVEGEMRKINPVLVGSFYPHHIMYSSIPSFMNAHQNVPADAAHSLHTARSLIGPIGKWTWHEYDNQADKVPTHHLLIPHDLCDDFRIVKGAFKGDSEIESHRAKRVTEDGVFL